jgi:hypothetical protein
MTHTHPSRTDSFRRDRWSWAGRSQIPDYTCHHDGPHTTRASRAGRAGWVGVERWRCAAAQAEKTSTMLFFLRRASEIGAGGEEVVRRQVSDPRYR